MIDAGRYVVPIGAAADEEWHGPRRHVARRHSRERSLDFELAFAGRQIQGLRVIYAARDLDGPIVDRERSHVRY